MPNATYLVCWDTTNNNTCDTGWQPTYGATTRVVENLAAGHVLLAGEDGRPADGTPADDGTWWRFTVVGAGHPGGSLDGGVLPEPDADGARREHGR